MHTLIYVCCDVCCIDQNSWECLGGLSNLTCLILDHVPADYDCIFLAQLAKLQILQLSIQCRNMAQHINIFMGNMQLRLIDVIRTIRSLQEFQLTLDIQKCRQTNVKTMIFDTMAEFIRAVCSMTEAQQKLHRFSVTHGMLNLAYIHELRNLPRLTQLSTSIQSDVEFDMLAHWPYLSDISIACHMSNHNIPSLQSITNLRAITIAHPPSINVEHKVEGEVDAVVAVFDANNNIIMTNTSNNSNNSNNSNAVSSGDVNSTAAISTTLRLLFESGLLNKIEELCVIGDDKHMIEADLLQFTQCKLLQKLIFKHCILTVESDQLFPLMHRSWHNMHELDIIQCQFVNHDKQIVQQKQVDFWVKYIFSIPSPCITSLSKCKYVPFITSAPADNAAVVLHEDFIDEDEMMDGEGEDEFLDDEEDFPPEEDFEDDEEGEDGMPPPLNDMPAQ